MGLFSKLFGKKPVEPQLPAVGRHIREALSQPPRLINEGPEFPRGPVVLDRAVGATQIEAVLAGSNFTRQDERWIRGETIVTHRVENGATLLDVSGDAVVDAQRELLGALRWVNPVDGFYERMESSATPIEELRYLACALRHYNCVGGIPMQLRRHADPEVAETVRLIDRDAMARAARAQRSKRK